MASIIPPEFLRNRITLQGTPGNRPKTIKQNTSAFSFRLVHGRSEVY